MSQATRLLALAAFCLSNVSLGQWLEWDLQTDERL